MANEQAIEKIENMLLPLLKQEQFLVGIKVKPTNNYKIYLDADNGISIDDCIKINRALRRQLDEVELHADGDFSLEVSSPGISEPLKLHRQYVKNIGRDVQVTSPEGTISEGKLVDVNEAAITLEQTIGKGKKAEIKKLEIPFENIKQTIVQIKF